MDKKQLSLINKAYDTLYDLDSKYRLFTEQLDFIKEYMKTLGYKVKINKFDKCIFIKENGN